MKSCVLILLLSGIFSLNVYSQSTKSIPVFSAGISYSQQYIVNGFVQVREWDLYGDKMKLKELGMNSYPSILLHAEKYFSKQIAISISYEKCFINGKSVFDRNIAYNGTLIDGSKGIDISPTKYYSLRLIYKRNLIEKEHVKLYYQAGIIYDYINFYLDGVVAEGSPRREVYEQFNKQAFPYPFLGLSGVREFNEKNRFNFSISGTYIPEFKSFYKEGGNVYLHYKNLESGISYSRLISIMELSSGIKLRYMYLFQESLEDTNIINIFTLGPFIVLRLNF